MPRALVLRLGVPYRSERAQVSRIIRKLLNDTSRTMGSKQQVIEALQTAERWFVSDEHRLTLAEHNRGSRGTSQEGQEEGHEEEAGSPR